MIFYLKIFRYPPWY